MSGHNFPSNPSTSDLPSDLPPHGSSFLPKPEAIKASTGHSTHEMEDSSELGSKSQEWQYQKNQPGRYVYPLKKVAGHGSYSLLGQYKPSDNLPSNKKSGSQPYGRDYLSDPYRGQINGGQSFYNPRSALNGGWVPPGQESETTTISSKSNIASTGQASRGHATSTAFFFHCDGDDHETRNCEKASTSKQAQKRKLREEKLGCCEISNLCRHHANKFLSLMTVTQEVRACVEERPISEWGTGSNAVAQGSGRKILFASTSVDTNSEIAGTSMMGQSPPENIGIQMNASSEGLGTLTNDCQIEGSTSESVPSTANIDERNISSSQSSITGLDGFCGLKETRNEMQKNTEKSEKDSRVCNLCKLTGGQHVCGCLNSKKFRYLRNKSENERIKYCTELAKKKKKRSEYMSEIRATLGIRRLFPDRPPSVTVTSPDEQQFLAYVDSIKSQSRKELEQLVIAHMFACERNKQDKARELELAKRMAYDFQEQINLAKQMQKREYRKKEKKGSRPKCTIGTQTESMTVLCLQDVSLTVHSPSPSFIKVEKVKASTSVEELSASNEDHSDCNRSSLTICNANAIQCDPIVSYNTTTAAVNIERQSISMLFNSSSQLKNRVEPLEIRKSTTTDANDHFDSHPVNVENVAAPSAGHPGKQLSSHVGPANRSTEHFHSSMARPSTSTRSEILEFVEQQSQRTLQNDPFLTLAASTARQPSALNIAYQLPYVSNYGNQQIGRQNVQRDPRLMKLETVKVETNEATGAPIQSIKVEASGSHELPIQIE